MTQNKSKAPKAPTKPPEPIHTAYRIERVDYITHKLVQIKYQGGKVVGETVLAEDLKGIVLRKLQLEVSKGA